MMSEREPSITQSRTKVEPKSPQVDNKGGSLEKLRERLAFVG